QGPALRADPIRLGLAKHVLDEAEQDHQLGAPVEDVRDQAYLSLRLTQTAEAEGAVRVLDERRRTASGELAYLELRAQRQAQQRAQAERQAAAEHSAQVSTPPA